MSDDLLPFLGEIRAFAYNFVPDGWVRCDGERRSTKTEAALYSIIGDKFGPKDQPPNTFALPDLRGCVVIGAGQGAGLSSHPAGSRGGSPAAEVTVDQFPRHRHAVHAAPALVAGDTNVAAGNAFAKSSQGNAYGSGSPPYQAMEFGAVGARGGNEGVHNNVMPSLTLIFCIAVKGIWPARP